MGITVSLQPPALSAALKRAMKTWLKEQLVHEELASGNTIPVGGLALYVNGEIRTLSHGYWRLEEFQSPSRVSGNNTLSLGAFRASNNNPSKQERLAVLGGVIGAAGLWDELTADYSKAVGRIILEAYNSCFFDMIQAPQPAVKLAFSGDKSQVAVQYRDDDRHWYLNNGEGVEVSAEGGWQIVNA